MRNQQELNVDAHTRASNAADRTRTQRRLQEAFQPPPTGETWWSAFWHRWFKWETLTVAGREVKGVVVQPWVAAILLTAVISAFAFMYQQNQAQREMLIRLDERLIQKESNDKERHSSVRQEMEGLKSHQAAIESVMNKQFAELKARR